MNWFSYYPSSPIGEVTVLLAVIGTVLGSVRTRFIFFYFCLSLSIKMLFHHSLLVFSVEGTGIVVFLISTLPIGRKEPYLFASNLGRLLEKLLHQR